MQLLAQIAGAFFGFVLFAAAFVFTSFVLAVAVACALVLWGWVVWRTRHARRAARRSGDQRGGAVIEGEFVVDSDERGQTDEIPKDPRP